MIVVVVVAVAEEHGRWIRAHHDVRAHFADLGHHLAGEGVLAGTIAPGVMRLVTHRDVDDEGLERAVAALAGAPD